MVGGWQIPISTGMTIGEFARMANDMRGTGCDLDVIGLEGWTRGMEYTDTGLPWVLPSPNIPTMDTVRLYSGTCFFEGTNLSEGRGRPGRLNGSALHGSMAKSWRRRSTRTNCQVFMPIPCT